jgi:hypothetical protein
MASFHKPSSEQTDNSKKENNPDEISHRLEADEAKVSFVKIRGILHRKA